MGDVVTADEFRNEQDKLEKDRAVLNERLQALNMEREATIQSLAMVAGALQTITVFLDRIDPEVDPEDEIDLNQQQPGPWKMKFDDLNEGTFLMYAMK